MSKQGEQLKNKLVLHTDGGWMSNLRIPVFVVLVGIILLGLWIIPEEMVKTAPGYDSVKREDVPQLVDEHRRTLAQIVGGLVLFAGLFFTWRTLQLNREGQITERFSRAIDQLGAARETGNDEAEKRMEVRLGGSMLSNE